MTSSCELESDRIRLSAVDVNWVSDLSLSSRHMVTVLKGTDVVESFSFRFSDVEFRNRSKPDVCLFLGSFYFTWQIWPVERTGDWCPCWSSEAKE